MKRPSDQAKLLLFALLRSSATALATMGDKTTTAAARWTMPTNPSIQLRLATRADVASMQHCNVACLPENYNAQFYVSQLRQWPDLALVAEDVSELSPDATARTTNRKETPRPHLFQSFSNHDNFQSNTRSSPQPKIVAYLLGKLDTKTTALDLINPTSGGRQVETLGHVTSLAVLPEFRRLGLAQSLMGQFHAHLRQQGIPSCGLHVRTSNQAACRLYQTDGYEIAQIIPSYYQDGEDAYFMRKFLGEPLEGRGKIYQQGPASLRLPRLHGITQPSGNPQEGNQEVPNHPNNNSNNEPTSELLTGSM